MNRFSTSLLLLAPLSTPGAAENAAPPFSMPVPDGWRTETNAFPLEFAPDRDQALHAVVLEPTTGTLDEAP